MIFSVQPNVFWSQVREAPLITGFIFGVVYGAFGGLSNGWMYGVIASIVGSIFYAGVGWMLFGLIITPILALLNRKQILRKKNVLLTGFLIGLLWCSVVILLSYGKFSFGYIDFAAHFMIFPACVMVGGCLTFSRDRSVFSD